MKYCPKCGTQLVDEVIVCTGCGCDVESATIPGSTVAVEVKNNQPISTGFKVCSLLFVSVLGGIFMLCDKDN